MNEFDYVDYVQSALSEIVEGESKVLLGALLGALLMTLARGHLILGPRKRTSLGNQSLLVFLIFGVGYLFEPLIQTLLPILSRDMSAFVAAVVVIPVSLKVMIWLDAVELRDIVRRWRR